MLCDYLVEYLADDHDCDSLESIIQLSCRFYISTDEYIVDTLVAEYPVLSTRALYINGEERGREQLYSIPASSSVLRETTS